MTDKRTLFHLCALRLLPLVLLAFAALGSANAQTDPPARVGSLSEIDGSVVYAPAGETEWSEAALNRPITPGDRLWTDREARAEVQLGSAVLHLDEQTFLDVAALDDGVFQASVKEGSLDARVRDLQPGENFELDTPQLAFRSSQPGDYRIDVDPQQGTTRVTVRTGSALVYGARGQSLQLLRGQQLAFTGRELELAGPATVSTEDAFDRWVADRNRQEDESVSARYLPRDVVGYTQLDRNGSWAQDADYGPVWYPQVSIADWAPYRYGRWEWITPWGWTWIDDARWGFAPFHYGRWARIGPRWAWVPGRLGRRPVYSPALVQFIGGGNSFSVGSAPGIGWYPLAPGEAWRPSYRASPVYVRNANRFIPGSMARAGTQIHSLRPEGTTVVRIEDFSRGTPVHRNWNRVDPADLARARPVAPPAMTQGRRWSERDRAVPLSTQPPTHFASPPVTAVRPAAPLQPRGNERRDMRERVPRVAGPREGAPWRDPQQPQWQAQERARPEAQLQQEAAQSRQLQSEQENARREQQRVQREQQLRGQREQQLLRERESQAQRARQSNEQQRQAFQEERMRQRQAVQEQRMQQRQAVQEQRMQQQELQQRVAPPQQHQAPPPPPQPQRVVPPPRNEAQRGPVQGQVDASGARGSAQAGGERVSGEQESGRGRGRGQTERFN